MSAPIRETKIVVESRWFEHGRWFYGFGSAMDDHREWRARTVVTESWPWTDWTAGESPEVVHAAAQRPLTASDAGSGSQAHGDAAGRSGGEEA